MFFPDPNVRWLGDLVKPWDGDTRMRIAVLGVPFDAATVSDRRGSRHAPQRIREYLYSKTRYSVEHDSELTDGVFDCGDLEVNIADFDETMRRLRLVAASVFAKAGYVLTLGGDHSLTYELVKAARAQAKHEIGLVQFDAHHDTREEWGQHSGFWLRRLIDDGVVRGENVLQIGIRGSLYSKYYIEHLKDHGVHYLTAWKMREIGVRAASKLAVSRLKRLGGVYLTFDIDAVDQTDAPGTDHPSPMGLTSWEAIFMVYDLASRLNARWMDIMEVSPPHDIQDHTVKLAAELAAQYMHACSKAGASGR